MTDVPISFFTPHDLSDEVAETVEQDLRDGLNVFENVFLQKGFTTTSTKRIIAGVHRGEKTRIAGRAAIRVIVRDSESQWHATRVKDDIYNFDIDCLMKSTRKEEVDRFANTFGKIVQNYLNRFSNLQPIILGTSPEIRAYDSWAGKSTKGYAQEGAYRVSRIGYWIKVLNPYVIRPNLIGC